MPCSACLSTLSQALESHDPGSWDYPHQATFAELTASAKGGCELCTYLRKAIERIGTVGPSYLVERRDDLLSGTQLLPEFVRTDPEAGPGFNVCSRFLVTLGLSLQDHPSYRILGNHPRLPMRHVKTKPDVALASHWVHTCAQLHRSCPGLDDVDLPTRLIYLGNEEQEPRLVETAGQRGRYIALSHCWGDSVPPKTQRSNIEDRFLSIPFASLPKTFQDAVTVVRSIGLGIQYLWIDCFCILQEVQEDFERECANMYKTFANATVTICGTEAINAEAGFLRERFQTDIDPATEVTVDVMIDHQLTTLSIVEEKTQGLRKNLDSALAYRAWIVQERLLSSRVLYFSKHQMYMECASADFFENLAYPLQAREYPYSKAQLTKNTRRDLGLQWKVIVQEYTMCDLTKGDDRLPALSGTARRMQNLLRTTYHAGLWRDTMAVDLAWARSRNFRTNRQRLSQNRNRVPATVPAPSWSWASCEHGVDLTMNMNDNLRLYLEIVSVSTPAVGLDPFGQVNARCAHLTVRGLCKAAVANRDVPTKRKQSSDNPDFDDWIYSADTSKNSEPIVDMTRDNLHDYQARETVTVMLVAADWDLENDGPRFWAALVLQQVSISGTRPELGNNTFRRIGLVTEVVRQQSLEIDELLGGLEGITQIGNDAKAWEWMQSGEIRTCTIV